MKPVIKKPDFSQEYFTDEQCYITELSNSVDDPNLSIARARVEPGVTTRWHRLSDTGERYYILQGRARVEIGNLAARELDPGDIVIIPPLCRQRITNIGAGDLIFLAMCTPRFLGDCYEDIEKNLD